MRERIENLRNVRLEDFKEGDTLYIQKIENDYLMTFLCQFVSLKRGIVQAKILVGPNGQEGREGTPITASKRKCYLYGKREGDPWPVCHWYDKEVGWK